MLELGGQRRLLSGQGVDAFSLLDLPRGAAFAIATFTLGVVFVLGALVVGFVAGSLLGAVNRSIWQFFDRVLAAMHAADFAIFPAKLLAIGLAVALVACLTALSAAPGDRVAGLLPRVFERGVLAIILISLVLSLAA
jgi:ABC-type transporter Mla maintaining outer membrane lipid asymmetry permease subunit MlaE